MRTPPAGVSEVGAPDAELASDAIKMAAAYEGALGDRRVIFHIDYAEVCVKPRIGRDGLCRCELLVDSSA